MSSKKLDAAIDALVDALERPEYELEFWQRGQSPRRPRSLYRRYLALAQAGDRPGSA